MYIDVSDIESVAVENMDTRIEAECENVIPDYTNTQNPTVPTR